MYYLVKFILFKVHIYRICIFDTKISTISSLTVLKRWDCSTAFKSYNIPLILTTQLKKNDILLKHYKPEYPLISEKPILAK